jgi:tetratricopeptide (TPR) repeat protein
VGWLLFTAAGFSAPQDGANSFASEFQQAREAEDQGKYPDAITIYQHILKLHPAATEAYNNLGLDYYRLNRYSEAAAALKSALKIKPDLLSAQIFLGLSEFKLGQFKNSLHYLETALKADPNNREIRLVLIQDQMTVGQFDTAFADQTRRLYSNDAELNYTIGLAALERTREIARDANSQGRQSPVYQWMYLRQAEGREDAAEAEKHREALKTLGSTTPPPLIQEYDALTSLVQQCFSTVLESSPDSPYAHSVQGSIDEAQNQIDEALEEYRKAGNHFAAGRLLAQNLRLPEAAEELEAAVRSDPENHLALADLAQVYVQEHEPERAIPLLEKILSYYPQDALAWADLGKAQISMDKTAEGVRSLRRALEINPSQTRLHYELAMAYRKLGQPENAQRELAEFRKASLAEHSK